MANEEKGSIKQMCTRPRAHLFGILALLICQPVADVEKNALDSLIAVDAGFREYPNLPDWIKKESMQVEIACEILKFAVDQDESRKAQVSTCLSADRFRLTCIVSQRISHSCSPF
jgi:serine/threonine-protein kinase ATR